MSKTLTFGGIPYTFKELHFYESGKVNGGGLTNPLTISIGGKKYQFDKVYFDSEGTIIQIRLSAPLTIKGKEYTKWTWIQLYNDGSFASASDKADDNWTGVKQ